MHYLFLSMALMFALLCNCTNADTTDDRPNDLPPVSAAPVATPEPSELSPIGDPADATTIETIEATMEDDALPPSTPQDNGSRGVGKRPSAGRTPTTTTPPPPKSEPFPDEEEGVEAGIVTEPYPDQEQDSRGEDRKDNPQVVQDESPTPTKNIDAKPKFELSHDTWDAMLRTHVSSSGKVNYSSFKKDQKALDAYLNLLQTNPPQSDWSKNKEMAYWINLYNAFTIKTILDEYPVKSIMDIDGGKVWDKRTITIAGKPYTLNQIEKSKLLKRFGEPRVHFAVNCAAASCPPLLNKAWTEDNIQRYYDKQAKAFINNDQHNSLSSGKVELSQIFNWYADDFGGKDQIIPYIQKYAETTVKDNAKVSFKDYDWSLNN